MAELFAELYGKKQIDNQLAALYIGEHWSLGKWLTPEVKDIDLLPIIINNLKRNLKVHLAGKEITTIEQLVQLTVAKSKPRTGYGGTTRKRGVRPVAYAPTYYEKRYPHNTSLQTRNFLVMAIPIFSRQEEDYTPRAREDVGGWSDRTE